VHGDSVYVFANRRIYPVSLQPLYELPRPLTIATEQTERLIRNDRRNTTLRYRISGGTPPYKTRLICNNFFGEKQQPLISEVDVPGVFDVDGVLLVQILLLQAQKTVASQFSGFELSEVPWTTTYSAEIEPWFRAITDERMTGVPFLLDFSMTATDAVGNVLTLPHQMIVQLRPEDIETALMQTVDGYQEAVNAD